MANTLQGLPIAENLAPLIEAAGGDWATYECLQEGVAEFFGADLERLDATQRDDIFFAYGYLRGLGDAWDLTALEVFAQYLGTYNQAPT